MRVMIDTQIFDELIEDSDTLGSLLELINNQKIELLITTAQDREIEKIPDKDKKNKIRAVPTTKVGTPLFILGYSAMNLDELGTGEEDGIRYSEIEAGNPRHKEDALIGITAAQKAKILVTNDKRFFNKILKSDTSLVIMKYQEFAVYVRTIL